jgi:hypothetical protein
MTWRSAGTRAVVLAAAVPVLMTGLYAATTVTAQASSRAASTVRAVSRVQNDCNEPGNVCIWQSVGFTGEKGAFTGSNGNWASDLGGGTHCPGGNWNNCASSIYNDKSVQAVNLWETVGDKDGHFCVAPMTGYSDFTKHSFSNGHTLNDTVSADFRESGGTC